jgi:hypothetical protein
MKFNDVSFPHPVLGIGDAIRSKFGLNPLPDITSTAEDYSITVNCEQNNADLSALISSGQAEYFCEATCSNTLYRQIFTSNTAEIKLKIPKKHVKAKIFFTCVLVAKSPIANYQNSMSHPDYDGYSFDIEKGDVLAFFGEFNFNADINYEKLKAVSSFMEVVENKDPQAIYTNIDLNKSKIEVQLPTEDYKLFANDSISKEPKFAPIFHSSIVFNALLMALYSFESHKDSLWAKVIDYRLKNENQFMSISISDKENIPEIAQRLLGNPCSRLISELQVIAESPNQNEED